MKPGMLLGGFCCVALVSCASPGYRYAGGPHGVRTLVDARADMIGPDANLLNRPVRILKIGNLVYPTWAMLQHVCGTINVVAFVDKNGKPQQARVESRRFNIGYVADPGGKQYTIAQIFDSPAINFVLGSEFTPALVNGTPEGTLTRVHVVFDNASESRCKNPK